MPIEGSLEVRTGGPTGTRQLLVDASGMQDGSARLASHWQMISWQLLAGSLASYMWTCKEGIWQVQDVEAVVSVTGGASATVDVLVCAGVTAPGSGTTQLTAVLDVQETAPFRARGTLIAAPTQLFRGDSVAVNFGGTLTGLVGLLSVQMKRVG
jgi:hypothetical protein